MANQGVFTRELSQLESIPRSLQRLEHRHTFTTRYGQIVPNFTEILYPNETLTLTTTNFLRTIPLKTPQLSRVRIFQRFVAVPMRIMWKPWEDYINAVNPGDVVPVEPYIANFNSVATLRKNSSLVTMPVSVGYLYSSKASAVSAMQSENANFSDFSPLGIAWDKLDRVATIGFSRYLDVTNGFYNLLSGYQFFPHELGDYLNAPVFSVHLSSDVSSRFSAFKFCAYQMAYNFFYRRPNVEKYVDDLHEMRTPFGNDYICEFPTIHSYFYKSSTGSSFYSPISRAVAHTPSGDPMSNAEKGEFYCPPANNAISDWSTDSSNQKYCEWSNVERFPLRSGENFVMQATLNDSTGMPTYHDSRISLTRIRYAPWLMDRFTSSNPWPQRNEESMIPVSGSINVTLPNSTTVSFSNLSVTVPESPVDAKLRIAGSQLFTYDTDSTIFSGDLSISADRKAVLGANLESFLGHQEVIPQNIAGFDAFQLFSRSGTYSTGGSASASFSSTSANVDYALSVSPSNFRFYMQLQHIKEMSGMTDGRYKSYMSMFFGSRLRNNQIDYPEFIGGFVQDLDISEIAQTSETDSTPLGSLAGRGVSAKRGSSIRFHAMEHCVVMGLLHILPDAEYIGGLNRVDHTTNPFDWVLPQFAGISEQPIRNSELSIHSTTFGSNSNTFNDQAFGYEPRFNELRARHSFVTGGFRDVFNSTGSYQYFKPWLIVRNFGFDPSVSFDNNLVTKITLNSPTLSARFLSSRGTVDASNFEVSNEQVMYPFMCDSYFDERVARIIPRRGIPRI